MPHRRGNPRARRGDGGGRQAVRSRLGVSQVNPPGVRDAFRPGVLGGATGPFSRWTHTHRVAGRVTGKRVGNESDRLSPSLCILVRRFAGRLVSAAARGLGARSDAPGWWGQATWFCLPRSCGVASNRVDRPIACRHWKPPAGEICYRKERPGLLFDIYIILYLCDY